MNAPLSREQLQHFAPSIFATSAAETTSEKYRFVPTIEVIDALQSEGFYPVAVAQSRSKTEDGRDFVKHNIRLRQSGDIGRKATFIDAIPELSLTNSHNGTSGFILDAALHRLVCANGLVVASEQGSLRYRHSGKNDLVGNIIEGAYSIVNEFPLIANSVAAWSDIKLEEEERLLLANAALPLRFDQDEEGKFPITADKLLKPRHWLDRGNTDLWTTFNAIQEGVIRGGIRAGYKNNRRVTTRKVTSVDKDLKLNRALWQITDHFAKQKIAA